MLSGYLFQLQMLIGYLFQLQMLIGYLFQLQMLIGYLFQLKMLIGYLFQLQMVFKLGVFITFSKIIHLKYSFLNFGNFCSKRGCHRFPVCFEGYLNY